MPAGDEGGIRAQKNLVGAGGVSGHRVSMRTIASGTITAPPAGLPENAPVVSDLLERDTELDVLSDAVERTLVGGGGSIYLEGPAGIGKSELVTAAAALADRKGFQVLRARGDILERDFSFGAARQLFEPLVTRASPAERKRLFEGAAGLAGPALDLGELPTMEASESSFAIQHGLYWLAVNISDRGPLLIAVDDAQWADDVSLRFLVYLIRRLEGLQILLVLAARAGEPGAPTELLAAASGDPSVRVVRPATLGLEAVAEIVRRRMSADAHKDFCAACHEASGGNPFLLSELLTAAQADGLPTHATAAKQLGELRPETISRSMLLRLGRLPEGSKLLARATAILGSGAETRHAATLADLDDLAAAAAVDALTAARILQNGRPLEFVHPLVRQVIYSDIPAAERALAHLRAARLLDQEESPPERIAAHLLEAEARSDAWVVEVLRRAAQEAARHGDPASATTYLSRALEEMPERETRGELLAQLSHAQTALGMYAEAARGFELALESTDDPKKRLLLIPPLRTTLFASGQLVVKADLIDRVLDHARGLVGDDPVVSNTALPEAPEFGWQLATAPEIGLAESALINAGLRRWRHHLDALRERADRDSLQDPWALAILAGATAYSNVSAERAAELAERALAGVAQIPGARISLPIGAQTLMGALLVAERYERLDEVCRQGSADGRRVGAITMVQSTLAFAARGAFRRGALADAEAYAREAVDLPDARLQPGIVAALLDPLVEHGALDEADQLLVETGAAEARGTDIQIGWVVHARGRLRLAQGRVAEGVDELVSLGTHYGARDLLCSPGLWCWRSDAALGLLALGVTSEAQALADEELALARDFGAARALGIALRTAGLVNGGDRGLADLRRSVAVLEDSTARLELARSMIDLGGALRRSNQRAEGRDHLRRGLDLASRCGAAPLAERAGEELKLAGGRPRSPFIHGRNSLTPAELRVAELASEGLSNPEIAQALFLTRKTIETHLGHVYQKLEIGSRKQLGEALSGA